ncbi:isochorismatase family protein [Actinospica durhamensis]|uniref:Isochorismatase family protein n=1 Tax=Actinospica durhamensis TaxID=1508375 RepID=A0A941EXC8_9ACTN|nr:isochorismatase family protein [Actinospica durhamensis]MBR7839590.1 isochorismatase family protein [Actinospica durhamensis]
MATTLLLLDLQRGRLVAPRPVPGAARLIRVAGELLERARAAGVAIVHVRHGGVEGDPDVPGTPGWELYHPIIEGEHVLDAPDADAFAGTDLAALLPPRSIVLTAGLVSDVRVRATVLAGLRQGYEMRLVQGAHAAYDGGGRSAGEIVTRVELELEAAGTKLVNPHGRLF